jgi:hypothetical protein
MVRYVLLMFLCQMVVYGYSQDIQSKVFDNSSKKPLPYISIGVVGRSVGTLTDENGIFLFKKSIISQYVGDTLRVSGLGFKSKEYVVKEGNFLPTEIFLEEEVIELKTITVSNVSYDKEKVLGTKSESSSTITGWGRFGSGGERGIKISMGKKKALLQAVSFYVSQNKFEEVLFRLHIRTLKNGIPGAELIASNIFTKSNISSGWITIDIKDQHILADNDILVSVEVVKVRGKCLESPCLIFSGQLLKGVLYAKEASQDVWRIKKRFSPSIYVTALFP